jgi:cell division protein ZapA
MAIINVQIRNSNHQIACNDGEEGELKSLATSLTKRINKLSENHAKANDNLLLIMAALTIEDELNELKNKHQQLSFINSPTPTAPAKDDTVLDNAVAEALDAISEYVENLVIKLDK